MKIKTIVQLVLIIIPLIGVIVGSTYFLLSPKNTGDKTVNVSEKLFGWKFPVAEFPATEPTNYRSKAFSKIRNSGGKQEGFPVRLKIPVIAVDSIIEDAIITADGRMDVPAGSVNVAWFSLGPQPGKVGNAVIGGHFGIKDNLPFVFYDLNKLKVGDKIYVVNDRAETLTFIVRSTKSFDRNADATTVFTSMDGLAHLNLITCEGVWNQVNDSYPTRLVVFSDALSTDTVTIPQEVAVLKPKLPVTAITSSAIEPTIRNGLIAVITLISIAFVAIKIIRR